ncbi:MAG: transposase, partial [Verrucomicrobia bacterium]|nr:transposase [Verrucomicrobiota bacterium]
MMNESASEQPLSPQVAGFVGIDWADQKHDVVLRSVGDPAKSEHQVIKSEINALNDWIAQMHERFGAKGKVLVCLEQSRGALIYHLMAYELFELYPINPSQLANYRKAFFSSGAKDDRPDADLLSELVMCHRDRLYGHNSRQEKKTLERLALIQQAKPLTTDLAIIRPNALRVKLLAQQLKTLLPFIAEYERRIA